jgi:hypothetical protein
MARRKPHVNPYKLLTFTQLTHEYARILADGRPSEERLSASRDLCEVLIERPENFRDACMADTIRSMIGRLQTHVGDQ